MSLRRNAAGTAQSLCCSSYRGPMHALEDLHAYTGYQWWNFIQRKRVLHYLFLASKMKAVQAYCIVTIVTSCKPQMIHVQCVSESHPSRGKVLDSTSKKGLCIRCFHRGCWGCSHTTVASTVVPPLLAVAAPSVKGANRLVPNDTPKSSACSCCLLSDPATSKTYPMRLNEDHSSLHCVSQKKDVEALKWHCHDIVALKETLLKDLQCTCTALCVFCSRFGLK